MSETKEFKAESKRLLEMMINSIYTHKEIFLRELISNASDAMDKLYFKSMQDGSAEAVTRSDMEIKLELDKDARKLTISDNGIGMTAEELENNLGTIAQSGSFAFKKDNEKAEDVDIIGQFGVGFYSAFMVAKRVTVVSKAFGSDSAFMWESEGVDGYTVSEAEKDGHGTVITLEIKDNTEDESYDEFLTPYKIRELVKKYSDYIRYPIKMDAEHEKLREGTGVDGKEPEYDKEIVTETLNSQIPIWKKAKSELKDEDYNQFYKDKFYDYTDPLLHIHSKTEGTATYSALLYIPEKAPYDYYSKSFEKGLQLYSSGVMIMEKCADLLPDYFSFVRGLVDSEDLSLNISREMLQHDRQLKIIAKSIEKSIKNELKKLQKNDREKYEKFFEAFATQIKYGIYESYGMNKAELQDLLMFKTSNGGVTTLEEYVSRMKEEQKFIYFASGSSVSRIESLPQTELVRDKGFEILYLTDHVDEFCLQMMHDLDGKEYKSVSADDLGLETEEEKEEIKKEQEDNKALFEFLSEKLSGKVKAVKLSQRLKNHPVCITSEGALSVEMEKVLSAMPNGEGAKAEKILEINPSHAIFGKLKALYESDKETAGEYAELLYSQALLIEGMPIENPVEFSNRVCEIMAK
ncbi:MAG: molecular chaperone HtpG [Lachnospiraceae bacterium]|nr:molecular chaperone HtpG [Ruminococcus sp.]MCM1275145.1 molecular chaperone HtpG [Lachnospiraceae bacterium]